MSETALSDEGVLSEAQMLRDLVRDMNANSERRNEAQLAQQAKDRRSKNIRFTIMVLGIGSMLAFYMYGFFVLNGGLSSSTPSGPYAAVVQLKGTIAEGSPANAITVSRGLSKAFKDPNAEGIVLYINSPGGSPVQSAIIYDRIQALKAEFPEKKIVTVATDTIASGAFWVASATDAIYVDRSTIAGSIGVVSSQFGFSDLIERYGVERRVFTAGESKASLDSFSPITDGDREKMAEILGEIHQHFIDSVKTGRGDRLDLTTEGLFEGEVWTGGEAVQFGLVDGLGDIIGVMESEFGVEHAKDYSVRPPVLERLLGLAAESAVDGIAAQFETLPIQ